MRVRARKDNNHKDIISAFIRCGCSVLDISQLGNCCDLIVSRAMQTWAIEIKDGSKPPSQRKLTAGELKFKQTWQGKYAIVESVDDVLALLRNY